MGLAISKRIINLMGGDMVVTSDVDVGSTFSFTFTSKLVDPSFGASEQDTLHRGRRILYIDKGSNADQPILPMLAELGFVPDRITDERDFAEASAELLGPGVYDAVLIDALGVAMTLNVLGTFPFVPLVLIRPSVSIDLKSALDLGIASCVTTPCRSIDLWNGILSALGNRPTRIASGFTRPLAVLFAEDNEINRKVALKILGKFNHSVTAAENGQEALEAFKRSQYDVVLMDIQMPVMGGFESTMRIREYEKENNLTRTPIVALTAHAMFGDREKCLNADMDDYPSKPIDQNRLMQVMQKYDSVGGLHTSSLREKI